MSIERPSVVFVVFDKDGSVLDICKTEYQARTKAGDEFEWWPCILKKINQ